MGGGVGFFFAAPSTRLPASDFLSPISGSLAPWLLLAGAPSGPDALWERPRFLSTWEESLETNNSDQGKL